MDSNGNGEKSTTIYLPTIGPAPEMRPVQLENIPEVLRREPRWCGWAWQPVREDTPEGKAHKVVDGKPKWTKWPFVPGASKLPKGHPAKSGHSRLSSLTWEQMLWWMQRGVMMGGERRQLGAGIVTGTQPGEIEFTAVDIDLKHHQPVVRCTKGGAMQGEDIEVAWFAHEVLEAGGVFERSVSGQGYHALIPGLMPEGHGRDYLYGDIQCEVYTKDRFLTVTGETMVLLGPGQIAWGSAASLTLERNEKADALLAELYSSPVSRRANRSGNSTTVTVELRRADRVSAADLSGALAAFRSSRLAPLWDGEMEGDQSRLDMRFCLTLFELLGDEPQGVADAWAQSGRWRDKCAALHGATTYLERTISRARDEWISKGCQGFGGAGQAATPGWTPEEVDTVVSHALEHTKGPLAARQATVAALRYLHDLHARGESHVHDGRIWVHTRGTLALSHDLRGKPAVIMQRLEWLAQQGYLDSAARDAKGALQVALPINAQACLALREGLRRPELKLPSNPPRVRPTTRAERRAPDGTTVPVGEMGRCQWTMWAIHAGARSVVDIAARTGQAERTIRGHLSTLRRAGMVAESLEPDISRELYAASVIAERHLGHVKTQEHRERATRLWREYSAARGTKRGPGPERQAELAAWDGSNIPWDAGMADFDEWLCAAD